MLCATLGKHALGYRRGAAVIALADEFFRSMKSNDISHITDVVAGSTKESSGKVGKAVINSECIFCSVRIQKLFPVL